MSESTQTLPEPINGAMAPKLTEWVNEPTAMAMQSEFEAFKPAHDSFMLKVRRWNDLSKVEGSARPKKIKGRSEVQPKLIRRQAEWRYSALTEPFNSSEKLYDVKPVTWEDGPAATQNQTVLNYQWRNKLNRVSFIDNYIRATVDDGTSIIRTGWRRYTKTVKEEVKVYDHLSMTNQEDMQRLAAAMQLKQANPRIYEEKVDPALQAAVDYLEETGVPTVAIEAGTQQQDVEKILDNKPCVDLVDPENFYPDPSCGDDLEKANGVIITFETSQAELKKDGRYKNLEYVNWEGANVNTDPDHKPRSTDTNFNFSDALRRRVVAKEYWGEYDIHNSGELVPIVVTWIGTTVVRCELNPFPDQKPPFVVVPYMPVKRQLMGESDAELLEDNQKILGALARGMIDLLARSANGQQGFAKGMLDVLNRRRFENGQDYEFNPTINPQNGGYIEHKYPEIPTSALAMLQMQNQEAEALTGVKAFSGGLSGETYGQVATGIRGVLDAAAKREMAILRRLANGLVMVGKKMIAMNQAFLSDKEVIRVTNEEFVTVRREDLAGNFDLIVDISTAEIDNNKAQDLAFMLQTMGPNMDFSITQMILAEIARLKRMPELEHAIRNYQPQPDPLVQKAKELEIAKLEMEIQKLKSEAILNQAKAHSEEVDAEQAALDTIEQETGTKHARDIEKQGAQAAGNQALEVTKALLKPKKPEESKPHIEAAIGYNELTQRLRDPRNNVNPDIINSVIPANNGSALDPTLSSGINVQSF